MVINHLLSGMILQVDLIKSEEWWISEEGIFKYPGEQQ